MTPTDGPATAAAQPASPPRRVRLWPLLLILAISAGSLVYIWVISELSRSWANVYTAQTFLLGLIFALAWLAFLSRLPWRTRGVWLCAIIAPLAVLAVLFKIDRVSGDLIPTLAWRFAPKPHERLAQDAPTAIATTDADRADLTTTSPRDYPEFMGPRRDSTMPAVRLARDWTGHPPRLLWRQPIGAGWSSFAVVGDYALTQEQRGAQELVTCYELLTGKLRWSYADDVYYESKIAGDGPRATPTIAKGRVYALGSGGLLNCLDGATGKRLWQRDTFQDTSRKNTDWGKACSPLVVDGLVMVTGGAEPGPTLVAYHAQTGELVWKADDQPTTRVSYGSPMMAVLAGVRQILMLNDNTMAGYDPATGKQLWEHPWLGPEPKVTQPLVVGENRLVIGSGYGVGSALIELTAAEDGRLTVREVWANRHLKPKFTNLVHYEGALFGLDEGILVSLDLATGERRWKKGRYNHGQIILVGDLLLVLGENGELVLVEATPSAPRELARFPALDGKTWGHPTLVPPYLLLRNDQEAALYELSFDSK